jgi:hypothetical protein
VTDPKLIKEQFALDMDRRWELPDRLVNRYYSVNIANKRQVNQAIVNGYSATMLAIFNAGRL